MGFLAIRRDERYVSFRNIFSYSVLHSIVFSLISACATYIDNTEFAPFSVLVFFWTFIGLTIFFSFTSLVCAVICVPAIESLDLPGRRPLYLSLIGITFLNIIFQMTFLYSFIWWIDGVDWFRVFEIVLTFAIPGLLVALL